MVQYIQVDIGGMKACRRLETYPRNDLCCNSCAWYYAAQHKVRSVATRIRIGESGEHTSGHEACLKQRCICAGLYIG
jgi:hypothetical protein